MIRLLPFALLILLLAGCQKNDSAPQINNDGPLLRTYYEMDDTAPLDTLYRMTYTYDSRNRIQSATKKAYFSLLQQSLFLYTYDSAIYYYSGDQVLPYRVQNLFSRFDHSPITEKNTYYTYDGTGLLIKDSSYLQYLGDFKKDVTNFRYANDIVWTEITKNASGSIQKDSMKTRIQVCGNNLCQQYDTLYKHPNTGYYHRTIKMAFDGSVNPFYAAKMRFPTWLKADEDYKWHFEENAFMKNNLLTIDYSSDFDGYSISYNINYDYTKNSDNAPVKMTGNRTQTYPTGNGFHYHGFYYY